MKKEKRRKRFLFLILLLLVLLLGVYLGARWIGSHGGEAGSGVSLEVDPNADDWDLGLPEDPEGGQENIAIPGYGQFSFRAGVEDQRVDLGNPKGNPCYFRFVILLKDGEELYASQLVPPGKSLKEIRLNRPLDPGTYPGTVLRYQCYSLDEKHTPLNGAEIVVTLTAE